jgi:hypothetical protein
MGVKSDILIQLEQNLILREHIKVVGNKTVQTKVVMRMKKDE